MAYQSTFNKIYTCITINLEYETLIFTLKTLHRNHMSLMYISDLTFVAAVDYENILQRNFPDLRHITIAMHLLYEFLVAGLLHNRLEAK